MHKKAKTVSRPVGIAQKDIPKDKFGWIQTSGASKLNFKDLPKPDDGTITVSVPTPKGWKCSRCRQQIKHRHTTFTDHKK